MIDADDFFFWLDRLNDADDLGRNVLSEGHTGLALGTASLRNRKGLAGYEWDPVTHKYHVRHRVLDPDTGRWTRRDPLGYVDGMGLYGSFRARPMSLNDTMGLCSSLNALGPRPIIFSNPPVSPDITPVAPDPLSDDAIRRVPGALDSPTFLPSCNEDIRRRQWNTPAQEAWRKLANKCPSRAYRLTINCISCASNIAGGTTCGVYNPSLNSIVICTDAVGNPSCSGNNRTLGHELIHARQACDYGFPPRGIPPPEVIDDWNNPENKMCQEIEAYIGDGGCPPGPSHEGLGYDPSCVCGSACRSVNPLSTPEEQTRCALDSCLPFLLGRKPGPGVSNEQCKDGRRVPR
ncbi:MAG: hypothetical protein KIT24_06680 [Phycisphaeraceae bacterium]|nr:hypothetical protein [Phycisphaeraceae bacterium]